MKWSPLHVEFGSENLEAFFPQNLENFFLKSKSEQSNCFFSDANLSSLCSSLHEECSFWIQCQKLWARVSNISCSDQEQFLKKKTKNVFKKVWECNPGDAKRSFHKNAEKISPEIKTFSALSPEMLIKIVFYWNLPLSSKWLIVHVEGNPDNPVVKFHSKIGTFLRKIHKKLKH